MRLFTKAFIEGFLKEAEEYSEYMQKRGLSPQAISALTGAGLGGLAGLGYEYFGGDEDEEKNYLRSALLGAGLGGLGGYGLSQLGAGSSKESPLVEKKKSPLAEKKKSTPKTQRMLAKDDPSASLEARSKFRREQEGRKAWEKFKAEQAAGGYPEPEELKPGLPEPTTLLGHMGRQQRIRSGTGPTTEAEKVTMIGQEMARQQARKAKEFRAAEAAKREAYRQKHFKEHAVPSGMVSKRVWENYLAN